MVKSYFDLYRRAKKLFETGQVSLHHVGNNEHEDKYFFNVGDHNTTLILTKNKSRWERHWSCDCETYSLFQEKVECKHMKACELYLMNGGYDE